MKKFLLSLVAMVMAIGVNAVEITTNATSGTWEGGSDGYSATINGYKISYLKSNSATDCFAPSADHIRVYKNAKLVIEAVDGSAITSLEFVCSEAKYALDIEVAGGNATASGMKITWTGNTTKFEGVTSGGQVRIRSIKINEESAPVVITGTGEGTVASPYDVTRALSIISNNAQTTNVVYVKGKVSRLDETYANTFFISEDGTQANELEFYNGKGLQGATLAEGDVKVGDEVVVFGKLTSYNGISELAKDCQIYSINGNTGEAQPPYTAVGNGSKENPYTVADIAGLNITASDGNKYWVKGYIIGSLVSGNNNPKLAEGDKIADTNLALSVSADNKTTFIPVELNKKQSGLQETLGVATHPENIGKEVAVYGTIEKYFGVSGVKTVTSYIIDGREIVTSINKINAANAAGTLYNLAGQKVTANYKGVVIVNGKKIINK